MGYIFTFVIYLFLFQLLFLFLKMVPFLGLILLIGYFIYLFKRKQRYTTYSNTYSSSTYEEPKDTRVKEDVIDVEYQEYTVD